MLTIWRQILQLYRVYNNTNCFVYHVTFTSVPPSGYITCLVEGCVVVLGQADRSHVVIGKLERVDEREESDVIDNGLVIVHGMGHTRYIRFQVKRRRHRQLQVSENGRLKFIAEDDNQNIYC